MRPGKGVKRKHQSPATPATKITGSLIHQYDISYVCCHSDGDSWWVKSYSSVITYVIRMAAPVRVHIVVKIYNGTKLDRWFYRLKCVHVWVCCVQVTIDLSVCWPVQRVGVCTYACTIFSSSWLTNVDGMKDLWCSSTVWLLSTQTLVNWLKPHPYFWTLVTIWLCCNWVPVVVMSIKTRYSGFTYMFTYRSGHLLSGACHLDTVHVQQLYEKKKRNVLGSSFVCFS